MVNIRLTDEQFEKLSKFMRLKDKYKYPQSWSNFIGLGDKYKNYYTGSRYKENRDYIDFSFIVREDNFYIHFSADYRCEKLYVVKEVFKNNKPASINVIEDLLKRDTAHRWRG